MRKLDLRRDGDSALVFIQPGTHLPDLLKRQVLNSRFNFNNRAYAFDIFIRTQAEEGASGGLSQK